MQNRTTKAIKARMAPKPLLHVGMYRSLRLLTCSLVLLLGVTTHVHAQCFGTFQFPSTTIVADDTGVPTTISTCSFAGDHALVSLIAGRTYRFTSSIATDHITISDAVASGAIASGTQPVLFTATATQTHFIHFHTNPACGTQNTCRTTQVTRVYCTAGANSCGGKARKQAWKQSGETPLKWG